MESDEITAPLFSDDEQSGEQSFSDVLDKLCVYYMMLGVPEKEFWDGDYTRLKYYVRQRNFMIERKNEELWLQGMYFYEALSVSLAKAFGKKGMTHNINYPEKPHRLTPLTPEEQEEENKRVIEEFRAKLDEAGRRFNAKKKREEEERKRLLTEQGGETLGGREPNL